MHSGDFVHGQALQKIVPVPKLTQQHWLSWERDAGQSGGPDNDSGSRTWNIQNTKFKILLFAML